IRIHEHDLVTLLLQRLAGLDAGIVKLAPLADDDGAGADKENLTNGSVFGHGGKASPHGTTRTQTTGAPATRAKGFRDSPNFHELRAPHRGSAPPVSGVKRDARIHARSGEGRSRFQGSPRGGA